jgi:hypothetical protein
MENSNETSIITDHSSLSSPEAKEIEEIEIQSQQHVQVLSTNNKSNLLTRPMGLRCSSKQKRTNHRKQYLPSCTKKKNGVRRNLLGFVALHRTISSIVQIHETLIKFRKVIGSV